MSRAILSQDEIEALLDGFGPDQERLGPPAVAGAREPQPISDVIERISGGLCARLDAIHRKFAPALSESLTALTGRRAHVEPAPAQMWKFNHVTESNIGTALLHDLTTPGLPRTCRIVLDSVWVLGYADMVFGGNGLKGEDRQRPDLSTVERIVMLRFLSTFGLQYSRAWCSMSLADPRSEDREVLSDDTNAIGVARTVVACEMRLQIGPLVGTIKVVLPVAALKPWPVDLRAATIHTARATGSGRGWWGEHGFGHRASAGLAATQEPNLAATALSRAGAPGKVAQGTSSASAGAPNWLHDVN